MKWLAGSMALSLLCGCITLTSDPRAVVSGPGGLGRAVTLNCEAVDRGPHGPDPAATDALAGRPLRITIWNVHKESDPGWQRDLSTFAAASDVLLLQETVLEPPLRNIIDDAGLRWVMASSFIYEANDIGVLTATRVAPLASCTQRVVEPLLRIPKSSVITWLRIGGSQETIAIANVHAINFDIFTDAYRAQLEALAEVLARHSGPIILAGDFNTWSDARDRVLAEITQNLGLRELSFVDDRRARFFGRYVDHVFIRGLESLDIVAFPVTSSDHNPIAATLRIP